MTSEAWALARRAAATAGVELRALVTVGETDLIARVMLATWGDHQGVPREWLRALGASGNVPYGAFDGAELVGYVLGWAGVDPDDGLHVHSHMLAALPDRRHRGVGYALKLAQRAQALEQGIGFVRWTFDPLVARNAYFNLHKLGAIVDRFERDYYGEMTDSVNRGERSDRFVVRWELESAPGPWSAPPVAEPAVVRRAADGGPETVAGEIGDVAVVEIPAEHETLRAWEPAVSRAWRDAVADAAERCLGGGLVGAIFDRERSAYVFVRSVGRSHAHVDMASAR